MAIGDRVKRKEDVFWQLLKDFSKDITACSKVYEDVVYRWPESADRIGEVKEREVACDEHLKNSLKQLAESFITPFDREDINELVHAMDEVPDLMEDVAARFELFHVAEMREDAKKVTKITAEAIDLLNELFERLPEFKRDQRVVEIIYRIHELEDEGDVVYRAGLAELFDCGDPMETIKWKSLLDEMEDALDAVNEIANVVLGVLLKNA